MKTLDKEVKLHVIKDHNLEEHNILVKFVRIFLVPVLNNMPSKLLKPLARKTSPYVNKIIERPGTTHSLEVMYTKNEGMPMKVLNKIGDAFWHNMVSQPKAVKNRLKLVEKNIEEEILSKIESKEQLTILNIGGGSSKALMNVLRKLPNEVVAKIKITNIDKDAKAIELGKEKSKKYGVEKVFNWINDDVRNLENLVEENSIDIVEMVGLMDYFNNESSARIVKNIFKILKKDGLFIVANVYPNNEMKFVENIGWPRMFYKTEYDLYEILKAAEFKEEMILLFMEPFKVHILGMAKKH